MSKTEYSKEDSISQAKNSFEKEIELSNDLTEEEAVKLLKATNAQKEEQEAVEEATSKKSKPPKLSRDLAREYIDQYLEDKDPTYVKTMGGRKYITYIEDGIRINHELYNAYLIDNVVGGILAATDKVVSKEDVSLALYAIHSMHTRGKQLLDYEPERRITRDKDGNIWLDLGLPSWDMVKITPEGWDIVPYTGEPFILRNLKNLPLPIPEHGGSLKLFRPFVNGSYEEFIKVCGFLIISLKPDEVFPPLVISGARRSGKSTLSKFIVNLLDNRKAKAPRLPKLEDIIVTATNNYILNFDNISSISRDLSDSLCRLVNGEAVSRRQLYTDGDEVEFVAARPCILNGIGSIIDKGDLTDRAIFVHLDPVEKGNMKGDTELLELWDKSAPKIFGGLLDAVVSAMNHWEDIELKEDIRFVDTTQWAEAAMVDLEDPLWTPGEFERLLAKSARDNNEDILDNEPLAYWIRQELKTSRVIEDTAQNLVNQLLNTQRDPEARKSCPHTTKLLYKKLEELKPLLAEAGIQYEKVVSRELTPNGDTKQIRKIRIQTTEPQGKEETKFLRIAEKDPF